MRAASAAILAFLAIASGCGGGEEPRGNARKGGSITVSSGSLPRVLDPARALDSGALQLLRALYTPPLAYRHAGDREGTDLVPGLARALPEVSEDGLTYSFRFRAGLRYSDRRKLRASDFERAVERARELSPAYARLYARVESIDADDRSGRVVVTLTRPDPTFEHVLALPASAPVPSETRTVDLSRRLPPGIGPYTLAHVVPGERVRLRRVKSFTLPDLPTGNVDVVTVETSDDPASQADAVATGTTLDLMQELPPADRLPEIRSKYDDRYEEQATASSLFLDIDPTLPPFHDRRVRQAVSLAVDGPMLERLFSGQLEAGCNLLPPAVQGYARLDPCPYGDRSEPPDLVRARELVQDAGADGSAVGVALNPTLAPATAARYLSSTLRKIGLAVRTAGGARRRGLVLRRAAPLVAHPAAYLSAFRGQTGDLELDAEIDALLTDPQADADDWAEVDRRLVEDAYAVPLGALREPTFLSERMDAQGCAVFHPLFGLDLAGLCLK